MAKRVAPAQLISLSLPPACRLIFRSGEFVDRAHAAIDDILSRGRVPVVVGGTMMYLQWLVHGKPDAPKKVTPHRITGASGTFAIGRTPAIRALQVPPATAVAHTLVFDLLESAGSQDSRRVVPHFQIHSVFTHLFCLRSTRPAVPTRPSRGGQDPAIAEAVATELLPFHDRGDWDGALKVCLW